MMTMLEDRPDRTQPALSLDFFSHATLECTDLSYTRRFFDEFFGFETVKMSPVSFWARLGQSSHIIVVAQSKAKNDNMQFLNHNGLDVSTDAEVDAAYEIVKRDAQKWGLHKISKPAVHHGTHCFYFWDGDGNAWEILPNPKGGYSWGFELGDQEGAGHLDKAFKRPALTEKGAEK